MTHPPTPPLALARHPDDPATLAFAGVIARSMQARRRPLIRGLDEDGFHALVASYFPGLECSNGGTDGEDMAMFAYDEFDDLVDLLLEHRGCGDAMEVWLAHAIATAAMGENHLWQDMGLPSRNVLSALLRKHFPTLTALNDKDMKWKKFFYRQLCQRAGVLICKSPHCADCCDYRICFGPEDA
ncbi:nitrogen fixation protein NifQ [Propionivibrio sp.]|uniref:nitrogen fixation protein NifQ n=1 Tax=Propionivibrio sp. TaxID=2212460 RepID=UPI0039E52F10